MIRRPPRSTLFPYTTPSDLSEISESVNFCVMEAIKLCRLDTPIIFIEARINLSRFVVTGCAAKTSATVTFPSLNLISLFAFCFNIWLDRKSGSAGMPRPISYAVFCLKKKKHMQVPEQMKSHKDGDKHKQRPMAH